MQIGVTTTDMILIIPMLLMFITSTIPLTIKVLGGNQEQSESASLLQILCGLAAAFAFILLRIHEPPQAAFHGALYIDGMSNIAGLVIIAITAISLALAHSNINTSGGQFSEIAFLTLNSAVGMLILSWANDLMTVFIGIEIMSLALYCLIALSHEQTRAKEAAFKYFVLGSFASAILLYGIAFLYGTTSSLAFPQIAEAVKSFGSANVLFTMGAVLVILGLCFKVSIFPFHAWTPDVYQGAPTPITAFMSTGVKMVMFLVFLRFIGTQIFYSIPQMVDVLQWLAVLTMIVGNIGAVIQDNLKRMLAYSAIANSGYLLVGVIVYGLDSTRGSKEVLFYLFTYTLANLGAFAAISQFETKEETAVCVGDLRGLAKERPWFAAILTVLFVSMAGLPPSAGFFGKFFIFSSAINAGLLWVTVWAMITSVVGAYYYLRPIVKMYMHEQEDKVIFIDSKLAYAAMVLVTLVALVLAVMPSPFFQQFQSLISMK